MDVFDRIKFEVKRNNTTQDWVAGKIGVSERTFRGWLSRKIMPNADQACAIAKALGVTVEYLVTGSDSTDPWLREHHHIIENLKLVERNEPVAFQTITDGISSAATRVKRSLGEASVSG